MLLLSCYAANNFPSLHFVKFMRATTLWNSFGVFLVLCVATNGQMNMFGGKTWKRKSCIAQSWGTNLLLFNVGAVEKFTTKNSFHTFSLHFFFFWFSLHDSVCLSGTNLCICEHVFGHRAYFIMRRWCRIELIYTKYALCIHFNGTILILNLVECIWNWTCTIVLLNNCEILKQPSASASHKTCHGRTNERTNE